MDESMTGGLLDFFRWEKLQLHINNLYPYREQQMA